MQGRTRAASFYPPLQAGTEDHTHYHEFSDLEQSVRDDVKLLRESNQ